MIEIVHIVNDEKFIDTAIEIFDNIKDIVNNTFYCYATHPIKFISNKQRIKIFDNEISIIETINRSKFNIIILHSRLLSFNALNKLNEDKKLIWISWGYDIYNQTPYHYLHSYPININIYKPLTLFYLRKQISLKSLIKYYVKLQFYKDISERRKFYRRVDFLSTILPIELEYIKDFCKRYKIKPFYFSYRRKINIQHDTCIDTSNKRRNILLGNSGAETNNHVDVLKILSTINLEDRKIIIPVSYSSNKNYITFLKQKVKELKIEDRIIYIEKFIPYENYVTILNTCEFAFFGHIRQQAIGNIYIMLRNRCRIFLYKDSFAYKQFIKDGYKIDTIEGLNNDSLKPLNQSDIMNNLSLLKTRTDYTQYIQTLKKEIIKISKMENITE